MFNSAQYKEPTFFEIRRLEDSKDVEGLIAVLKHSQNKNVIKLAIRALGRLKDDKAVEPLIDKATKGNYGIAVRQAAVRALGDVGGDRATEILIFVMLRDEHLRAHAAEALGKIGDAKAVKPLIFVLEGELEGEPEGEDEHQYVREKVVEALGKIATEEAIASLIGVLNTSLGEEVSLILKQIGEPAVDFLISALDSKSQTMSPARGEVVTILGEIGDKKAVQPLLSLLENENEDEVFRGNCVAAALGRIGSTDAVEPLIKLASKHTEDVITCGAVEALGDIGSCKAVDALIAILEDDKTMVCPHLRLRACRALRKLKDTRAIEPLIRILENPGKTPYALEEAAASALVELDDDRINLPLLRYFKVKLGVMTELKAPELGQFSEMLETIGKLIFRLINKGRMS